MLIEDAGLITEFLVESDERLERIEELLLEFERDHESARREPRSPTPSSSSAVVLHSCGPLCHNQNDKRPFSVSREPFAVGIV